MTDRKLVYPASIPLETDILKTNKNAMLGVAELARTVLGVTTLLDGFSCTANSPAALNVIVGAGRIYALANVDATDFGSLLADTTHNTVKQGQFWDAVTLPTPAPATIGFSVVYLVQIALQEVDSTPVVLPYYNAANPSVAYSGPGNTGVAQNTERLCRAIVSIKTGVAATTGTQATPAPDAGYTGAWAITVANGQTTVTSPNIVALSTAPFITETLIDKLSTLRMQNETPRHATAGGTADAITATYTPAYAAWVDGMTFFVKLTAANTTPAPTVSPSGLTAKTIVKGGGTALTIGDQAVGMIAEYKYSSTLDKCILQNPQNAGRLIGVQSFLTAGTSTYTPTAGTTFVIVEVVGAGAGSIQQTTALAAGYVIMCASGGTGAYARGKFTSAFSGVTVTVGAGGALPASGTLAANAGGSSSFGALITCAGGVAPQGVLSNTFPINSSVVADTAAPSGGNISSSAGMGGGQCLASSLVYGVGMYTLSSSKFNGQNGNGGRGMFVTGGTTGTGTVGQPGGAIVWEYA